jgi:hypothetical protein
VILDKNLHLNSNHFCERQKVFFFFFFFVRQKVFTLLVLNRFLPLSLKQRLIVPLVFGVDLNYESLFVVQKIHRD